MYFLVIFSSLIKNAHLEKFNEKNLNISQIIPFTNFTFKNNAIRNSIAFKNTNLSFSKSHYLQRYRRQTLGHLDQNEDYYAREISSSPYINDETLRLAKNIAPLRSGDSEYASSLYYLIATLVNFTVNIELADIFKPNDLIKEKLNSLIFYIKVHADFLDNKNNYSQLVKEIKETRNIIANNQTLNTQEINDLTKIKNTKVAKRLDLEKTLRIDERYLEILAEEYKNNYNDFNAKKTIIPY
ncbi:hypothetical protein GVAV_002240 [Gurleya vavrai]